MKTRKIDQMRWNPEMKELERFQIEIPIPIEKPEVKSEKPEAKSEKPAAKKNGSKESDARNSRISD